MCMEDIRIGRKSRFAIANIPVGIAAAIPICQTEEKRTALIISVAGANSVVIAPQGIDVSVAGGILLNNTSAPYRLDLIHYGRMAQMQFNAIALVGVCTVTVQETLLEET